MMRMAMKRRQPRDGNLAHMVDETAALVERLLRENRALKARNERLAREVERLSKGWDDIRRLARAQPRRRRASGRR